MLLECDQCSATVKGEEVASFIQDNPADWVQNVKYTLFKCPQCKSPMLASQEIDYIEWENAMDWGTPVKIFPSNQFHINPVIPEQLRKALAECIKCYKANSFTATVIMSRRAIEGFCS